MADSGALDDQVCVIGAGISALQCAQNLREMGASVAVLEAADYVGGRIRQNNTFIEGVKLDLGAETVHGNNTVLYDLLNNTNQPMQQLYIWAQGDGGPLPHKVRGGYALYYLGDEKKVLRHDVTEAEDADFVHLNVTLSSLGSHFRGGRAVNDPRTLEEFLVDVGVAPRMMGIANAGFANTLCSDVSYLSFARSSRFALCWDADGDEADFRLPNSFEETINHLKQGLDIHLNTRVIEIDYSNREHITVHAANGKTFNCRRVVVTVPIPILKDRDIRFNPELPVSKRTAVEGIRMERAMKIVLTFSERFFPSNLHGMICGNSPIPECWFRDFTALPPVRPKDPNVACYAVGYVTAKYADALAQQGTQAAIRTFLNQLDEMFSIIGSDERTLQTVMASKAHGSSRGVSHPVSSVFLNGFVWDWAEQPYVRGGYGSPAHGYPIDCPERLAAPIQDRLFFAGEATCSGGATTAHAAMGSGIRASYEVAVSLIRTGELEPEVIVSPHIRSRL